MTKIPTPGTVAGIVAAERAADMRTTVPQVILPIDQVMDGAWMHGAACGSVDPELFHDPGSIVIAAAQNVCAECPFNQPCRAYRYATGASGTWGGVYYADSAAGVRNDRKKCALMRCTNGVRTNNPYCSFACEHKSKAGTPTGYGLHLRAIAAAKTAGVPVPDEVKLCQPCKDAQAADVAHRRRPVAVG